MNLLQGNVTRPHATSPKQAESDSPNVFENAIQKPGQQCSSLGQGAILADTERSNGQSREFLAQLLQRLGENAFKMWFNSGTSVRIESQSVRILVDNDFLVDCIRSFCFLEIRACTDELFGKQFAIVIVKCANRPPAEVVEQSIQVKVADNSKLVCRELASTSKPNREVDQPTNSIHGTATQVTGLPKSGSAGRSIKPIPTFLFGQSNRLAAAAAEMVLERPGELGPLFIHGPNGVGKSHLCKSLRERLKSQHELRRVMYMTAEQFTIDFSESTRGAGFAAFRKKYRDVEALLIDDVQFFIGKSQTLAELRNTIDDLLSRRRQVVFAADRSLADLVSLGSDLHARLSGGIACSLQLLDQKLRHDLLQNLCKQHDVQVNEKTLEAIAERTSGDGRAIYGIVFRLMAQQRSNGNALSSDEAINCTLDLIRAGQPVVRLSDIERVVCDSFGLEPKSLKAKNRSKNVSGPRMLAMFLARKHTLSAYAEIGEFFGNRQHSTVISAQKRVEDWLASNENLSHRSGRVSVRDLVRNAESMLQVG